jgi:hypothetical protein
MALELIGETLHGGYRIFREENEVGGHRYWSDEIGGGVCVWDTCLAGAETLQACIELEKKRLTEEEWVQGDDGGRWVKKAVQGGGSGAAG